MSIPNQLFTNNAVTFLAAPISSSSTSLTVMSGYGSLFPLPIDSDDFFLVTLEDPAGTLREIIRVTSRTGDTFNGLVRAQEGTIARSWSASLGNDTLVDHRVTAETMSHVYQATANDIIISGVTPLSSFVRVNTVGEQVWSVEISDATTGTRGAMTAAQVTLLGLHTTQIATNTFDITQRAALSHVHSTADVTGLQGELNTKSNIDHNHDLLYSPLSHVHSIVDVTGLQGELNTKSNISHNHDLLYSPLSHVHSTADVSGLTAALALKSDINHSHSLNSLSDVNTVGAVNGDVLAFNVNDNTWAPTQQFTPSAFGKSLITANSAENARAILDIKWTLRATPTNNMWTAIAWNGTVFAAVASTGVIGNNVMTSPDGITWTLRATPANNNWTAIAWNGTMFAVVDTEVFAH